MSLFSALNAKILAEVDRRSGVSRLGDVALKNDRLVLTLINGHVQELPWAGLKRVISFRRDIYARDEVSLLLEFDAAEVVDVPASTPGWTELSAAIDTIEGARPFSEWFVEVLATPIGHGVTVWSRERFEPTQSSSVTL